MQEEVTYKCVKCGKEKRASQMHHYEGNHYCCSICCGDTAKNEHKQKLENACEFC